MNVLIYNTEEQIGIAAGNYMCGQVLQKPNSVLNSLPQAEYWGTRLLSPPE